MSANVGAIEVDLVANTAAFRSDMGKAADAVRSNTAQMTLALGQLEKGFKSLEAIAGTVGLAVGLGEIAAFVKDAAGGAGELANLAKQLGATAANIQVLRFAAAQSGVPVDALDTSIAHLTRTVGNAVNGNDDAIRAFKQLGVGVLDAGHNVRSTDDILADLATGFTKIPTEAEKGRLAVLLFGRSGQQMLSLLAGGRAGLDDFSKSAHDAGVVLSDDLIKRFDEAGNASAVFWINLKARAAEAAGFILKVKDALAETAAEAGNLKAPTIDDSGAVFQRGPHAGRRGTPQGTLALSRQQGGPVGGDVSATAPEPTSVDIFKEFPGGGAAFGGAADVKGTSDPISDSAKRAAAEVKNLIAAMDLERESIGKTDDEILRLKLSRELDVDATVKQGTEVRKYTAAQVDDLVAARQRLNSAKDLDAAFVSQTQSSAELRQFQTLQARTVQQLHDQVGAAAQSKVEWDDLTQSYRINNTELLTLVRTQEIMNSGLQVSEEDARKMAAAQVGAQEDLRKSNAVAETSLKRTQAAMQELEGFTDQAFDHVGQALSNAFINGKSAAIDWLGVARSVLADFQLEVLKLGVVNPLKNAVFGSQAPTFGDMGKLASGDGGLFGKMFGAKGPDLSGVKANPIDPDLVAMDKGLAGVDPDAQAAPVVDALGTQTDAQSGFFDKLGTSVGGDLSSLGSFLNSGLTAIVSAITSLVASSGAGGAAGAGGGLFGLFGSSSSSAGGAPVAADTGSSSFYDTASAAGMANGSDSAPGGPTVVGEQGREIVNLPKGAQVLPNGVTNRILGGGSGSGTTIVADLRGASLEAVQRLEAFVRQVNGSIERRSVAANVDAARRGGNYRQAFAFAGGR